MIRQVIRARRTVDGDGRDARTAAGDPAERAIVQRAEQWVGGEPPGGPLPGGAA